MTKGAIVSVDPSLPVPRVIAFQYNPDTMTRTLQPQAVESQGSRSEVQRLKGAPVETISLEAEFDATDKLENPDQNPTAVSMGVLPQLSALEMMLYPKSSLVVSNVALAALGSIEIIPAEGPFTLFIWGASRVLPVRITDFKISEEAYDTHLNPIRAKVTLGMRVLTYDDLELSHPGYAIYFASQVAKEIMADVGTVTSLGSLL